MTNTEARESRHPESRWQRWVRYMCSDFGPVPERLRGIRMWSEQAGMGTYFYVEVDGDLVWSAASHLEPFSDDIKQLFEAVQQAGGPGKPAR